MVRTHMGYHDNSYGCVFQQEDDKGNVGHPFRHLKHDEGLLHLHPDCCNAMFSRSARPAVRSPLPDWHTILDVLLLHVVCCMPTAGYSPLSLV